MRYGPSDINQIKKETENTVKNIMKPEIDKLKKEIDELKNKIKYLESQVYK